MVSSKKTSAWDKLLVTLIEHLFWKLPMVPATWVGRQVFDRPVSLLIVAAPAMLVVLGAAYCATGINDGKWGRSVRLAWKNEDVARANVERLRKNIEQHGYGPAWSFSSEGGSQLPSEATRQRWQEEMAQLKAELSRQKKFIPSLFSVFAPEQHFPTSQAIWRSYYQMHHLLFGSLYPRIVAVYLLLGLVSGWKGSRRWWRWKWRRGVAAGTDEKLFLGLDGKGRAYFLRQEERDRHLLISGTTGSGKTEALKYLARHDVECGRGLVFIDMKGDRSLAESLFTACVKAGRKDDFLYFTFEPIPCHRYNALASGDALAKRDRLISACTWSPEPFYKNEAKAAASRVLAALSKQGAITFDDLYLAFDEKQAYAQVSRWASAQDRPKFARDLENWSAFWRNTSGLRANLHEFLQLPDRLCAAHGDIDFREVHARNRIVYFELNSQMRKEAASSLAKLILEDIKHLSGTLAAGPAQARKPFSVYIDEARNAVYDGFVAFISQCRSAGIGLVLATQSPLDFDSDGNAVRLSVTQNTATKLIFCQRDPASAQFCAELGGTKDAMKRTAQMVDEGLLGPTSTGVYSERDVKEFHVHPDELKSLGVGRAYLIQDGGTRTVIRIHHEPITEHIPFAPTIPRRWHAGDQERLGYRIPPLALGERLAAGHYMPALVESRS